MYSYVWETKTNNGLELKALQFTTNTHLKVYTYMQAVTKGYTKHTQYTNNDITESHPRHILISPTISLNTKCPVNKQWKHSRKTQCTIKKTETL